MSKELLNKARAFKTRNVPHPEGKKSKRTGEVLTVTQYSTDDFKTVYTSSDIITLGGGKTVKRFLISDLTDDEVKTIKTLKGDETLRKIMLRVNQIAEKISNTAKNSGVILDNDKRVATNDFIRHHIASALDDLMQVKDNDKSVNLPF